MMFTAFGFSSAISLSALTSITRELSSGTPGDRDRGERVDCGSLAFSNRRATRNAPRSFREERNTRATSGLFIKRRRVSSEFRHPRRQPSME